MVQQDTKNLGFEQNNLVDSIIVTVDTDSTYSYQIYVEYPESKCDGKQLFNIIDLQRSGNECSVVLEDSMMPFNGRYIMQLVGKSGDKVYHSKTFEAWVNRSIKVESAYDPVPSEFKQIQDNIVELNNHPPKPNGTTGFWDIWNLTTKQYEQSNIPVGGILPEVDESTAGKFLTNNGVFAKWDEIEEVPPMGEDTAGKILTNDGTNAYWEDAPETGVTSLNGETGDLFLKTVNGETVLGSGNIQIDVPTKVSELENDTGYITDDALNGYATEQWVENKEYITAGEAPVQSVNGKTGDVQLNYNDVGADVAGAAQNVQNNLNAHIADKSNPHEVTKQQVGLGNVDNTSDMNKPVSTAQASAIGAVQSNLDDEISNRQEADEALDSRVSENESNINTLGAKVETNRLDIVDINSKIPTQATESNQLADKAFVNSSINSAAAYFRGTYANNAALMSVAWQTTDPTADYYVSNNDYAYVEIDETHNNESWRYIYVLQTGGTNNGWQAQFKVNDTPFTQSQLDAINSGATTTNIAQITTNTNDLSAHKNDKDNPHEVTKAQVGLGNVANERQYSANNQPPYPVTSVAGKTGAVTLVKGDVGLGNVDNTSDANKPISTPTKTYIDSNFNPDIGYRVVNGVVCASWEE